MKSATLKTYTYKDLAQMAKKHGVPGWHSMRKDQLVRALVRSAQRKSSSPSTRRLAAKSNGKRPRVGTEGQASVKSPAQTRAQKRIDQLQTKLRQIKNIAASSQNGNGHGDRLVVMVRDPYWLHAFWELSTGSVQRAEAALGQQWHTAQPILRLYHVEGNGSDRVARDIRIHGGVNNWYVDVTDPPCRYRLEIGYLASDNQFHAVARSNTVNTPPPGTPGALDENWTDVKENADRIYALSGGYAVESGNQELQEMLEDRLHRPLGSPIGARYGAGAGWPLSESSDFQFLVDAELIIYGVTRSDAHVTLKGQPVDLRPDGTFTVRLSMPDRRQVIPVVARTSDGAEQRTIAIAVERNTKVMEPISHEAGG